MSLRPHYATTEGNFIFFAWEPEERKNREKTLTEFYDFVCDRCKPLEYRNVFYYWAEQWQASNQFVNGTVDQTTFDTCRNDAGQSKFWASVCLAVMDVALSSKLISAFCAMDYYAIHNEFPGEERYENFKNAIIQLWKHLQYNHPVSEPSIELECLLSIGGLLTYQKRQTSGDQSATSTQPKAQPQPHARC